MNRCPTRMLTGIALGALLATVLSSRGQQQTIQFSKPVETDADKTTAYFLQDSQSKLQGRAGEFNAPKQLFSVDPAPRLAPPQMPQIQSRSLRDELNRRKNWTLMTPEEIMGVPSAEKILGLPDPTGDDKRTPEENFLRRHQMATASAATNGLRRADSSLSADANPFAPRNNRDQANPWDRNQLNQNDSANPMPNSDARADTGSRKYFDRLVNAPGNSLFGNDQKANSAWANSFDLPPPPPSQQKQNLERIADMERFRAIMEPAAPVEKPIVATRFSVPTATASEASQQRAPLFNPLGQSYTPLQSSISRPVGVVPLPSLFTPNLPKPAPKKSLVDLPPWLSKDPQAANSSFNTRTW